MFIQTEETPNPATLKFLPGLAVSPDRTVDFADPDAAVASPLAERLFKVEGVSRVFLGSDFVTVTKATDKGWALLKPAILGVIMEHFTTGRPVFLAGAEAPAPASEGADSELVAQI